MSNFNGQVAIVTGAASGLGLAIAKKLHAEGAAVALLDLNDAALQTAAKEVGSNAVSFAIDLTKQEQVESVVRQIAERFGLAESSLINALLKRLGAGGDRCKRVIDLVNYTRRQTSHGRQLLSSSNGVDRLNTHGNILANRDNVCYFTRYRVFHRNFAYNPMTRRTVVGDRLLFNAFQLAGFKNPLKFLPQSSFGKFCEHGEYIPADRRVARYALHTNFAVAIPRHDAIIAVDHVKRYRQRVENCLRKLSIFFFCLIDRVVKGRFKMG